MQYQPPDNATQASSASACGSRTRVEVRLIGNRRLPVLVECPPVQLANQNAHVPSEDKTQKPLSFSALVSHNAVRVDASSASQATALTRKVPRKSKKRKPAELDALQPSAAPIDDDALTRITNGMQDHIIENVSAPLSDASSATSRDLARSRPKRKIQPKLTFSSVVSQSSLSSASSTGPSSVVSTRADQPNLSDEVTQPSTLDVSVTSSRCVPGVRRPVRHMVATTMSSQRNGGLDAMKRRNILLRAYSSLAKVMMDPMRVATHRTG